MKKNGLWVIAFVIVALMVLTTVNPASLYRTEEIDDTTYHIGDLPLDNPDVGDLWFDTTLDEMNIWSGYIWQSLSQSVSGSDYTPHAWQHSYSGGDSIDFHTLSARIRVSSDFAESGSGTPSDPWINGINEAILDLPPEGGLVYVPAGLTVIDEYINYIAGEAGRSRLIVLQGAGKGFSDYATKIKLADNTNTWMVYMRCTFAEIKDLMLDGNADNQAGSSPILTGYSFPDIRISNLCIYNSKGSGIKIEREKHCVIENCWIEYCDLHGIEILGDSQHGETKIMACHITNNAKNGIKIVGATNRKNSQIIATTVDYSYEHGVLLQGVDGVAIIGGVYEDNSYTNPDTYDGIHLENNSIGMPCKNVTITNTIARAKQRAEQRYGIYIDTDCDYNIITDNQLTGNRLGGVYVSGNANRNGSITNNIGYCTEKSSSSTILNTNTHVTVTHEMDVTPTSITVTGNHSEVSACWIVNITSTQFEIWVSAGVTYDRVVYWYAEAR